MWWAGIGWRDGDFEVVVLDGTGHESVPVTRFGGRDVAGLTALLRESAARAGDRLGAVVESTNGVLDGHLLAAGLSVYRPHPRSLPRRTAFGSVPARELAETTRANPSALHTITISAGALVGRQEEEGLANAADVYPHLVELAASRGHFVGNHTWSHAYLPDLSRDELLRQVDTTGAVLAQALGAAPTLVRPPYGARTPEVLTWLAGHGLTSVVWDVDAGDWAEPGVDAVVDRAAGKATGGSIILMHDAGGDRSQTVAALPRILRILLDRGHRLVRVDELGT